MINHRNNSSDFFKGFIQKAETEAPSDDFTKKVMQKIESPVIATSLSTHTTQWLKNWYFIAIALSVAIVFAGYFLINGNYLSVPGDFDSIVFPVFKKIFQSITGLFHSLKLSSFTIVVFLSVAALFGIERILNKFKTGKQTYFSF